MVYLFERVSEKFQTEKLKHKNESKSSATETEIFQCCVISMPIFIFVQRE